MKVWHTLSEVLSRDWIETTIRGDCGNYYSTLSSFISGPYIWTR